MCVVARACVFSARVHRVEPSLDHLISPHRPPLLTDIPTTKIIEYSREAEMPNEAFDVVLHDGKIKVCVNWFATR